MILRALLRLLGLLGVLLLPSSFSATTEMLFRPDRVILAGVEVPGSGSELLAILIATSLSISSEYSLNGMRDREFLGASANRQKKTMDFFCLPTSLEGNWSSGQLRTEHLPNMVSMLRSPLYRWPSCTTSQASSRAGSTERLASSFLGSCSTREYHWTWAL